MRLANVGIGASVLCAAHCAALPALAGISACSAHEALHQPWLESSLAGSAALIGLVTLGPGFLRHRRPAPLLLLAAGLAALAAGHWVVAAPLAAAASVTGAALLVAAQLVNRRCPAPCCAREGCSSQPDTPAAKTGAGS